MDEIPHDYRMLLALPFLFVTLVLLPTLAWLSLRQSATGAALDAPTPSVRALATQSLIAQALVGGFATLALFSPTATVSWRVRLSTGIVLAGVLVVAGTLGLAWIESRRPLRPQDIVRRALRRAAANDPLWIGVTLVAGAVEEYAYRGVLTAVLANPLGMLAASFVSAGAFGLAHLASGWRAVGFGIGFAVAMQGLVQLSGGVLLAIVAHATYDLLAAWLARRVTLPEPRSG